MCFSYSYLENEAWALVGGQSRLNFRFICGWDSSNTRRILSMVCQRATSCLMRSEMLSGLMPFHHLWSTIQRNMYVTPWNIKSFEPFACLICLQNPHSDASIWCRLILYIDCCFENICGFNSFYVKSILDCSRYFYFWCKQTCPKQFVVTNLYAF